MAVKHDKTSSVADGPDTNLIQPSDWNADHTIEADSINTTHIDWGSGANQVDADDVPESSTKKWAGETGADVTGSNAPQAHAASHTDGTDDIQNATAAQKGLATSTQITKLDGIETAADVTDATNVAAAGALMVADIDDTPVDGETSAPISSNWAHDHVDAADPHPGYALESDALTVNEGELVGRLSGENIDGQTAQEVTTLIFGTVLAENTIIQLDPALSADGKYSGITVTGTAGAVLAFGEVVYLAVADTKWEKAKGDAEATVSPMTGVVVVGGNENATVTILLYGHIRADAAFPTMTVGAPVFISAATAGAVTTTELTTGQYQKIIGWASTADSVMVVPNPNWVKVA